MSNPVPRLRRLLAVIPLIQRRGEAGISLDELQEILGVSRRELQGDLNAILLCGVPPYLPNDYISMVIENDRVTVDFADHFARPARLTLSEALALRLAIERLPLPEDGNLQDAAIELLDTLDRQMRKAGEGDMAALEGKVDSGRAASQGEKQGAIEQALARRCPLEITYYSASSETVRQRVVRPFGQGDRFGNQYLVAEEVKDGVSGERRTFRLDRISKIELLPDGESYEIPADFDIEDHLGSMGGGQFRARLRFDKGIAREVAEDFAEQRVEEGKQGDVVVELKCGSLPWAVGKALLYGELCEVLEPPEARQELVRRLEAYLA